MIVKALEDRAIFNIGDEVDYVKEDIRGKVQRKGTNYINEYLIKSLIRFWLQVYF